MIETLQDILGELADKLYIYGGHDDVCESNEGKICRVCWEACIGGRIRAAIEIEHKLEAHTKGKPA